LRFRGRRVDVPKTHGPGDARRGATSRGSTLLSAPLPGSVASGLAERRGPDCHGAGVAFMWSHAKLRIACLVLLGAATPAVAGIALSAPVVRWLSVAWLAAIAFFVHCLSRRACDPVVVLLVDQRGIFDRRVMPRPIAWQEIAAICPVDTDRCCVIDIDLRWPKVTLEKTHWSVRIGAYCQTAYNVPAVSISMLLLECNASQFLQAVAQYRPDLLHHSNRRALIGPQP
jgi:hypothetical protein